MTYAELTRKLRALGCVFKRQAKGSHEVWHLRHLEISPGDLREP